jgi:hypothetical protein
VKLEFAEGDRVRIAQRYCADDAYVGLSGTIDSIGFCRSLRPLAVGDDGKLPFYRVKCDVINNKCLMGDTPSFFAGQLERLP